jgi:hypothetical protein
VPAAGALTAAGYCGILYVASSFARGDSKEYEAAPTARGFAALASPKSVLARVRRMMRALRASDAGCAPQGERYDMVVWRGLAFCVALFACSDKQSAQPAPTLVAPVATQQPAVAVAPQFLKVRITTDPDGASVKEDGIEQCSSTPCDISYKGPDADPAKDHKLTIWKPGYKVESKSIRVGDSPVSVKLTRAPVEWHPAPAPAAPKKNDTSQVGDYGDPRERNAPY